MTSEEIFEKLGLKEQHVYKVEVKITSSNVPHYSILFTGFRHGSYCVVYNNSYEQTYSMIHLHSLEVVEELCSMEEKFVGP